MEIRQLIYFKTIVEQGTISKAAQVLHMAQPPLSMQLKQLEDELETQLIERGTSPNYFNYTRETFLSSYTANT